VSEGNLPQAQVYTDGGCDPNPGPGGWGAVIRFDDHAWELWGNDPQTTNNRMELQAAIAALALLKGATGRCRVDLHTDSEYLRRGITEWIDDWQKNGWRTADKQPVKNRALWQRLHELAGFHAVSWHWLKGHAGHPLNERADRLATKARRALKPETTVQRPADDDPSAVEICVKASCLGSPGPGGWAAVLRMGDHVKTISGGEPETTANAMLIRAAAEGLKALRRPCRVYLYSDAEYLIKGATLWVKKWQQRNWRTREGKPVANRDEWESLLAAAEPHRITWQAVRGEQAPQDLAKAETLAAEAARAVQGFDEPTKRV
jgi:ribonuclease HI